MTPKFYIFHLVLKYKVLVAMLVVILILFYTQVLRQHLFVITNSIPESEQIDAVYTWVNGSDPRFLLNLKNLLNSNNSEYIDFSPNRFDDKYELKFSLRSIEKYAPWIRHVYIVTNGQIPYWLNLDYEGVTIVTHEEIFSDPNDLPTFSSPAIESHLHRIPGISRRFIYLNDDIFFGAPVYKDDFYMPSRGHILYFAWPLPNCASDCAWMYVNDGQCDAQCYNEECQMDGTDCDNAKRDENGNVMGRKTLEDIYEQVSSTEPTKLLNLTFMDFLRNNRSDIIEYITKHNTRIINQNRMRTLKKRHFRLWKHGLNATLTRRMRQFRSCDAYSESLQYTNRLLNKKYGFKTRFVAAHTPIMIDVAIMNEMQRKFEDEVQKTSSHKLRSIDDVQFSFLYYYYIIQEQTVANISHVFDRFDTDKSGTWSDREIRTLLARLYALPLSYGVVDHFEAMLTNCTKNVMVAEVSTPEFERYIDSKLPTISKELLTKCPTLESILVKHFGQLQRFKYHVLVNSHVNDASFKMISSNISIVVAELDEIRRSPNKFICLNDNLDPAREEDNELIKSVLYDFYLSLFPLPSKYELSLEFRNRFLYVDDLNKWKHFHFQLKFVLFAVFLIFLYVCTFRMYTKRMVSGVLNKMF